jgi:hypothetical protein
MPPLPSNADPRPPGDFAGALATETPILLVGGQAVNLWALYYENKTSDLAPFVSRDADVLGDQETLTNLGKVIGAKPQFFPLRPPTNEVGVVIAKDAYSSPMLIEVLRYVHGASNEELSDPVYTMAIGQNLVPVKVPGPIALLKAKIANVADINQAGRQDGRHVLILTRLMPAYLNDLNRAALDGRLDELKLIALLEQLLGCITTSKGQKVLKELAVSVRELFSGLEAGKLNKLRNFIEKRLPRAFPA